MSYVDNTDLVCPVCGKPIVHFENQGCYEYLRCTGDPIRHCFLVNYKTCKEEDERALESWTYLTYSDYHKPGPIKIGMRIENEIKDESSGIRNYWRSVKTPEAYKEDYKEGEN
ncbi:MAG: hypothetical protein ABSF21_00095 [Dehalococcoidia bacterium]|jgi:hypothetical protein